ncbi:acetate/propionate family kinase [Mangrovicoccus algicola]|uniref:Acetate kinase n=1 Tax=Mangrovicoccus algicola TaxID=2771008 RepID=A0A8J6YXS7_9RHOB|nr:acetate/propionate family kinase [Mangrovicoccus algicola]MBE3639655.1 acetate/propionate family kinase [Mangrovicoccus algicola]
MSYILTLNAGSSSLKYAVYRDGAAPELRAVGQVDRIGSEAAHLVLKREGETETRELGAADHARAVEAILDICTPHMQGAPVAGVGHRIVHGGTLFDRPAVLNADILSALHRLVPLAPLHQPHNLAAVRAAMSAFPDAVQVGCFDTAFHRSQPWVDDTFALPREYYDKGIRRYGFHGLSYDYITGELDRIDAEDHHRRTVVAHLGNGASMCAIKGGKSVASTMGFTALDGLPMGTRCGQLDPGVLLYLIAQEGMGHHQIRDLLYHKCGLLGLSGISNDMRELEASPRREAKEAIDYYVFRIRRELGGLAAAIGGLETLVFCGGIGENSALVRARVCEGMEWMGIAIDPEANAAGADVISTGAVTVRVIRTDEEGVIARAVSAALAA